MKTVVNYRLNVQRWNGATIVHFLWKWKWLFHGKSRQKEEATGSNTLSTHVKRSLKVKTTVYASLKNFSLSDDFKLQQILRFKNYLKFNPLTYSYDFLCVSKKNRM